MFSLFSIFLLSIFIVNSYENPINNINNITDVDNSISQSSFVCQQNDSSTEQINLFELLNTTRYWFILLRSKHTYGEETWNNAFMRTSLSNVTNDTIEFEFVGENNNGSCAESAKGQITPSTKLNRVLLSWPDNKEGFLEVVFMDSSMIHFFLCHVIDFNQTDICTDSHNENFVVQYQGQLEHENDTMSWLKSHCSSINEDNILLSDNPKKCAQMVSPSNTVENSTAEQSFDTITEIVVKKKMMEEDDVIATTTPNADFTTHGHRSSRLEVLETYYHNMTEESIHEKEQHKQEEAMSIKTVTPFSTTVSFERLNSTYIEQTESTSDEVINKKVPSLVVLHKAVMIDTTTTEVFRNDLQTTQSMPIQSLEKIEPTGHNINVDTLAYPTTVSIGSTTEKELPKKETTPTVINESTVLTKEHVEKNTSIVETTIMELTNSITTVSTTSIPADCPILKDCPYDYCDFARKFDHHGCPTCNCVQATQSSTVCPTLTCPECLYGHFTDPYGCPTCQCQNRPYPSLGERCPQLSCEPCYFGTVKDEYNCDTCICIRPNRQECPVLNCTFGPCKYGSIIDEDDCPTCECLLPKASLVEMRCPITTSCPPCHLGYLTDADGCQTCHCKNRGSTQCLPVSPSCHCEYGYYLDSDGCETCSCLPDPRSASRYACWELSNQVYDKDISEVKCASDGSFYARQCDLSQSKCWCVTLNGIRITGFESRPEENANCACAVELHQVSSLRMIGHHLLCLPNGNYAPIQCDGRHCSCVDESGKLIGPTVSIQNRDQLRCVGVYQQLHPERYLLHQTMFEHTDGKQYPFAISSSLCLTHLEQVRNTKVIDEHILIPVCDANGLYSSVQCDQIERYCWCVDQRTGVEMEGTRQLNARPNCNNS